jgi:chromosome segregation ATPase
VTAIQGLHEGASRPNCTVISAATVHDAIRAAQREGEFERLARERAEADLQTVNEALLNANKMVKQLQIQLQDAHRGALRAAELEPQLKAAREHAASLQEQVSCTQRKLKDCKQELVSKTERLKAAKVRRHAQWWHCMSGGTLRDEHECSCFVHMRGIP